MSNVETKRPPLAERIKQGLEEAIEWERDERRLRVTVVDDGQMVDQGLLKRSEAQSDASPRDSISTRASDS